MGSTRLEAPHIKRCNIFRLFVGLPDMIYDKLLVRGVLTRVLRCAKMEGVITEGLLLLTSHGGALGSSFFLVGAIATASAWIEASSTSEHWLISSHGSLLFLRSIDRSIDLLPVRSRAFKALTGSRLLQPSSLFVRLLLWLKASSAELSCSRLVD